VTNSKKVELTKVDTAKEVKLRWKVARQIQQELLEKKLMQYFSNPAEEIAHIKQYPMIMQPLMKEFIRKVEEQAKPFRT
jgi:hypothetical protein